MRSEVTISGSKNEMQANLDSFVEESHVSPTFSTNEGIDLLTHTMNDALRAQSWFVDKLLTDKIFAASGIKQSINMYSIDGNNSCPFRRFTYCCCKVLIGLDWLALAVPNHPLHPKSSVKPRRCCTTIIDRIVSIWNDLLPIEYAASHLGLSNYG
ncbi:hypothetical protein GJ496_005819 [Pomphorhynchus laevis]|nr:hypothetical protein GJ496_005819 [Pomphorhynchus laevis]